MQRHYLASYFSKRFGYSKRKLISSNIRLKNCSLVIALVLLSGCASVQPTNFKELTKELSPPPSTQKNKQPIVLSEIQFLDNSKNKIGSVLEDDLGIPITNLYLYKPENMKIHEHIADYLDKSGYDVRTDSTDLAAIPQIQVSIVSAKFKLRGHTVKGNVTVKVDLRQSDYEKKSVKGTARGSYKIPVIMAAFRPQRWMDRHEDSLSDLYGYLALSAFKKAYKGIDQAQSKGERP